VFPGRRKATTTSAHIHNFNPTMSLTYTLDVKAETAP
jgi:hypothetical protein